jgi:hypothetical protein
MNRPYAFDAETEKALRKSGWRPSRSVDTTEWVAVYRQQGYDPFPAVQRVWTALGGLQIKPRPARDARTWPNVFSVGPGAGAIGADIADYLAAKLGKRICPIGDWSGECIVFLAEDDSVYVATNWALWKAGDSVELGVRCLVTGEPPLIEIDEEGWSGD